MAHLQWKSRNLTNSAKNRRWANGIRNASTWLLADPGTKKAELDEVDETFMEALKEFRGFWKAGEGCSTSSLFFLTLLQNWWLSLILLYTAHLLCVGHCARQLTYLIQISSSQQHYEVNTIITLILQMRRLKLRKLRNLMKVIFW